MPTSTIANRRFQSFDKLTELRDNTLPAVAADQFELGVPLVAFAFDEFKCVVENDVYTGYAAGTVQWTATIEAATAMGGTYKAVGTAVMDGSKSSIAEIALSGQSIEQVVPGAKFVRIRATKLGSAGALTYGAFLSPVE